MKKILALVFASLTLTACPDPASLAVAGKIARVIVVDVAKAKAVNYLENKESVRRFVAEKMIPAIGESIVFYCSAAPPEQRAVAREFVNPPSRKNLVWVECDESFSPPQSAASDFTWSSVFFAQLNLRAPELFAGVAPRDSQSARVAVWKLIDGTCATTSNALMQEFVRAINNQISFSKSRLVALCG